MDENRTPHIYAALFIIYRDKIYEEDGSRGIVQIKYRPSKKEKRERTIPLSKISVNGLVWDRVKIWPTQTKEIIARYERFKEGYYKDVKGQITPTDLTQRLDNLIYESFDNSEINNSGC